MGFDHSLSFRKIQGASLRLVRVIEVAQGVPIGDEPLLMKSSPEVVVRQQHQECFRRRPSSLPLKKYNLSVTYKILAWSCRADYTGILGNADVVDSFGRASAQVKEGHHDGLFLALHLALGVFSNQVSSSKLHFGLGVVTPQVFADRVLGTQNQENQEDVCPV